MKRAAHKWSQDSYAIICKTLFVAMILAAPPLVKAQNTESRKELWPEVDVFIKIRPKFRLVLMSSLTKAEETRDNLEGNVQAALDYIVNKKVTLRAAYRYAFSLSGNDPFREHRVIFEQTFRQPLPGEILLSDRNREEIRTVNSETSARYRNRI